MPPATPPRKPVPLYRRRHRLPRKADHARWDGHEEGATTIITTIRERPNEVKRAAILEAAAILVARTQRLRKSEGPPGPQVYRCGLVFSFLCFPLLSEFECTNTIFGFNSLFRGCRNDKCVSHRIIDELSLACVYSQICSVSLTGCQIILSRGGRSICLMVLLCEARGRIVYEYFANPAAGHHH